MTQREALLQEIQELPDEDVEVLRALVRRLRAKPLPKKIADATSVEPRPALTNEEAKRHAEWQSRPHRGPMADQALWVGDVESPIEETWNAEEGAL